MPTSPEMSLQLVISLEDAPLTPFHVGYFKAMAQDEAHAVVLDVFLKESQNDPRITRAFLARRTGKDPAQITKFLSASGNWTLDTYALLLAGLGYRPVISCEKLSDMRWANESHDLAVSKPAPRSTVRIAPQTASELAEVTASAAPFGRAASNAITVNTNRFPGALRQPTQSSTTLATAAAPSGNVSTLTSITLNQLPFPGTMMGAVP